MFYEVHARHGQEARAAGRVSTGKGDKGGVSYGAYQLASSMAAGGQVREFLKSPEGRRWAVLFDGLDASRPGGAFGAQWKAIAAREPDAFFEAQHAYIRRTHYDPVVRRIRRRLGLDVAHRSFALQNVVWSTAVQHAGAFQIIRRAVANAGGAPAFSGLGYDRRLIDEIYRARAAYVDQVKGTPRKTRHNLHARYAAELQDAIGLLKEG